MDRGKALPNVESSMTKQRAQSSATNHPAVSVPSEHFLSASVPESNPATMMQMAYNMNPGAGPITSPNRFHMYQNTTSNPNPHLMASTQHLQRPPNSQQPMTQNHPQFLMYPTGQFLDTTAIRNETPNMNPSYSYVVNPFSNGYTNQPDVIPQRFGESVPLPQPSRKRSSSDDDDGYLHRQTKARRN